MRMRFGVLVSAALISGSGIACGPAAANPMLIPHGIAAGSLASEEKPNNSDWRGETGVVSPPGYSSRIPEAFYRSADGGACQVEDHWTPHGWREVTICD
jgi:hypothetical protein